MYVPNVRISSSSENNQIISLHFGITQKGNDLITPRL